MMIEDRIKKWREDEDCGMGGAIELICEAEEELRRLRGNLIGQKLSFDGQARVQVEVTGPEGDLAFSLLDTPNVNAYDIRLDREAKKIILTLDLEEVAVEEEETRPGHLRTIKMQETYWHGTTAAEAILALGVDFDAVRVSDPGDMGWGFYLTGEESRAKAYGSQILKVTIDPEKFAYLPNPYFLDGLKDIEPITDVEKLFHEVAFGVDGNMKTCSGYEKDKVARKICDTFIAAGFSGIITPYSGGEVVVFAADGITEITKG
jgi:hypothetical protein